MMMVSLAPQQQQFSSSTYRKWKREKEENLSQPKLTGKNVKREKQQKEWMIRAVRYCRWQGSFSLLISPAYCFLLFFFFSLLGFFFFFSYLIIRSLSSFSQCQSSPGTSSPSAFFTFQGTIAFKSSSRNIESAFCRFVNLISMLTYAESYVYMLKAVKPAWILLSPFRIRK